MPFDFGFASGVQAFDMDDKIIALTYSNKIVLFDLEQNKMMHIVKADN